MNNEISITRALSEVKHLGLRIEKLLINPTPSMVAVTKGLMPKTLLLEILLGFLFQH